MLNGECSEFLWVTDAGWDRDAVVFPLPRSVSSPSLRTPGISPRVKSRYWSPRWDFGSSIDCPCVQ